uniref:Uncharacterized protein n=1 Tax=Panagrolaimus sp. ES5 TaxID=591445 RepID=A0AC34FXH9_9BILA
MELLKEEVKKTLELNTNSQYYLYYGVSPDNIHFAVLATKGLWYKLYLFGNLDGRQIYLSKHRISSDITHFTTANLAHLLGFPKFAEAAGELKISTGCTEHTTEEGVKNRIEQCKTEIENGLYNSMFPLRLTHKFEKRFYFEIIKQPSEVITDPDGYLQLGDIICNKNEYGIYIGNGEVVYSRNEKPEIGKLNPDFANPEEIVEKYVFPYSLRDPEKIVEIAKSFVNPELQQDEYKLLYENPLTFIGRSALGLEIPLGQTIIQNLLQKLHI